MVAMLTKPTSAHSLYFLAWQKGPMISPLIDYSNVILRTRTAIGKGGPLRIV